MSYGHFTKLPYMGVIPKGFSSSKSSSSHIDFTSDLRCEIQRFYKWPEIQQFYKWPAMKWLYYELRYNACTSELKNGEITHPDHPVCTQFVMTSLWHTVFTSCPGKHIPTSSSKNLYCQLWVRLITPKNFLSSLGGTREEGSTPVSEYWKLRCPSTHFVPRKLSLQVRCP